MLLFNVPIIILVGFTFMINTTCDETTAESENSSGTPINASEKSEPRIVIQTNNNNNIQLGKVFSRLYSENIVFPDEYEEISKYQQSSEVPKCPQGEALCEDVDNYPYKIAQIALKHAPNIAGFFEFIDDQTNFISNRVGIDDDGPETVCGSIKKKVFPQIGKTSKNEWKYIVNQKGTNTGYAQGVEQETCIKENAPCLKLTPFLGYTTYCKQSFRYQRFLSIASNGELETESFQIPAGCCCSLRRE